MIKKINHIGIAVNSIEDALKLYTDVLGLKLKDIEVIEDQKVRTAIIPVGESKIELLESTHPEGAIAKHIENRGEGIHHLALEVSDIQGTMETLKKKGIQLIDEKPRKGVEGTSIAFLHPKGTKILLEIVEPGK
jgi:methylmalonyl-CoA epimerase